MLNDYYGTPIVGGDVVKIQPWSLNSCPENFFGKNLIVAGQDATGMLVVVKPEDGEAMLVFPESVYVAERDGETQERDSISWWATVVAKLSDSDTPFPLLSWPKNSVE